MSGKVSILAGLMFASMAWGDPCVLTVHVVDAHTKAPLAEATTTVRCEAPAIELSKPTDSDGVASFSLKASDAKYHVFAEAPRYNLAFEATTCEKTAKSVQIEISEISSVSIMELITNPLHWHGRHVQVIGFINLQFEGDAIFFHKEDWVHSIRSNALWIDLPSPKCKDLNRINKRYVLIEGTFDANKLGHMSAYRGTILDVDRCVPWH